MPLGDSITAGEGDPDGGGYRDPLYGLLSDAGHTFEFVGSQTSFPTEALVSAGQSHHEGHSGAVIESGITGLPGMRDNIADYLNAADPDLILLMIGTNDLSLNYQFADAPNRLNELLTDIHLLNPDTHTIVANLIPTRRTSGGFFDLLLGFNAEVPIVVSDRQAAGQRVSFLDMYSFLTAPDDLVDNLHPNPMGYDNMATAWEFGINEYLAIPEPSGFGLALGIALVLSLRSRKQHKPFSRQPDAYAFCPHSKTRTPPKIVIASLDY